MNKDQAPSVTHAPANPQCGAFDGYWWTRPASDCLWRVVYITIVSGKPWIQEMGEDGHDTLPACPWWQWVGHANRRAFWTWPMMVWEPGGKAAGEYEHSVMATSWKRGSSDSQYVKDKGFLPGDLPVMEYARLQGAEVIGELSEADADTLRRRALHDRRGTLYAEIVKGSDVGFTRIHVYWSVAGRCDQLDGFCAGEKIFTCRESLVLHRIAEFIHAKAA